MQLDMTNLYLIRENHNLPNHSWPMRGRPEEVQRHMQQLLRKAANPTPPIPALTSSRRMTLHTETIFAMGQCQSQPRQKPTTKGTHPFQNSRNPTYGHCLNHYLLDGTATVATTRGPTPRSTSLRMVRAEKVTSRLMVQNSELQEDGEDCPQAWEKREERGEGPDSSDEPDEDHNAAAGAAPSSPTGPPPTLTTAQRARLHALLQKRDAQGRVPYDLDQYNTDAEMWTAYRTALRTSYRSHRKQQRAMGTWSKDQARWTSTPQHGLGARERSPLAHYPDDATLGGHPFQGDVRELRWQVRAVSEAGYRFLRGKTPKTI